jgi:hypothetical protein
VKVTSSEAAAVVAVQAWQSLGVCRWRKVDVVAVLLQQDLEEVHRRSAEQVLVSSAAGTWMSHRKLLHLLRAHVCELLDLELLPRDDSLQLSDAHADLYLGSTVLHM